MPYVYYPGTGTIYIPGDTPENNPFTPEGWQNVIDYWGDRPGITQEIIDSPPYPPQETQPIPETTGPGYGYLEDLGINPPDLLGPPPSGQATNGTGAGIGIAVLLAGLALIGGLLRKK